MLLATNSNDDGSTGLGAMLDETDRKVLAAIEKNGFPNRKELLGIHDLPDSTAIEANKKKGMQVKEIEGREYVIISPSVKEKPVTQLAGIVTTALGIDLFSPKSTKGALRDLNETMFSDVLSPAEVKEIKKIREDGTIVIPRDLFDSAKSIAANFKTLDEMFMEDAVPILGHAAKAALLLAPLEVVGVGAGAATMLASVPLGVVAAGGQAVISTVQEIVDGVSLIPYNTAIAWSNFNDDRTSFTQGLRDVIRNPEQAEKFKKGAVGTYAGIVGSTSDEAKAAQHWDQPTYKGGVLERARIVPFGKQLDSGVRAIFKALGRDHNIGEDIKVNVPDAELKAMGKGADEALAYRVVPFAWDATKSVLGATAGELFWQLPAGKWLLKRLAFSDVGLTSIENSAAGSDPIEALKTKFEGKTREEALKMIEDIAHKYVNPQNFGEVMQPLKQYGGSIATALLNGIGELGVNTLGATGAVITTGVDAVLDNVGEAFGAGGRVLRDGVERGLQVGGAVGGAGLGAVVAPAILINEEAKAMADHREHLGKTRANKKALQENDATRNLQQQANPPGQTK